MAATRAGDIAAEEFAERRAAVAAGAGTAGFDALLLCSRGGGTVDRFANVLYLTNFYTTFPYIPDRAPDWTGRAHSFMILLPNGESRLIVDIPYLDEVRLPASSIVRTDDVMATLLGELRKAGLGRARIGLIGEDILPWAMMRQIQATLPDIKWQPAEEIIAEQRAVKSPGEIGLLREAADIGSRTIEAMLDAAVIGATHGDIVAAGQGVLNRAGGILYNSFMASGRGGDEPKVYRHNLPTWGSTHRLENGEWLRLGISGISRGYYFDVSRSKAIGQPTNRQVEAFEAAIAVIEAGASVLRPGVTAGEVAERGLKRQEEMGFPLEGVFSGLGHGIGLGWDWPWLVRGESYRLKPGMVINIERTLQRDGYLGDFEETFLITEKGPELLTNARVRSW